MAGDTTKLTLTRGVYRGNKADFSVAGAADTLTVDFNPSEYSLGKSNSYAEAAIPGLDHPIIQYSRGEAQTLSLELVLDTLAYGDGRDIRETSLKTLERFIAVDGELHAPPPVQVAWGSLVFTGVLTELNKRFVLFLDSGRPVRARVTLSFKEYVPVEIQVRATPRSSPDKRKLHHYRDGDSLPRLAWEIYGDVRHWKVIADANRVDDPLKIAPGTLLDIPSLPPRRA